MIIILTFSISLARSQNVVLNNDQEGRLRLYVMDDNQKVNAPVLKQNYPNPFKNFTNFEFAIPTSSKVTLKVFSLLGKELTTLVNQELSAGKYRLYWDAGMVEEGVYFYIMEFEGQSITKSCKVVR